MLDEVKALAHLLSHHLLSGLIVWNKLVKRRIEQTDVDRHAVHALQDAIEILLLQGQKLGQSHLTASLVVGKDHLSHGLDLISIEEHMLGAAQADAHCTKPLCHLGIVRSVGIGAHHHAGVFVTEVHELGEIARDLGRLGLHLTLINLTGRTVD